MTPAGYPWFNVFPRASGYSPIEPYFIGGVIDEGPGGFAGPYLTATQSLIVPGIWNDSSFVASLWLIQSRDVT